MKVSSPQISSYANFRGYDAAPIKRLYLQDKYANGSYLDDMLTVGNEENFEVETLPDTNRWMQDNKTFIYKDNTPSLVGTSDSDDITDKAHVSSDFIDLVKQRHNIETRKSYSYVAGGNIFIGRKEDGEKWLLIGEEEPHPNYGFFNHKHKYSLSELYGVKEENIHFIPQQNYHLDTFIRPIGYPYVLVNDPGLVLDKVSELKGDFEEVEAFRRLVINYIYETTCQHATCDDTVKALTKAGFKPIRIAGDYCHGVNFMNAVVNKHADGSISYITGSSKCASKLYSKLQDVFESDLREKVPNIDKTYFIEGKRVFEPDWVNYLMYTHKRYEGGLHCLSLEEPDFEKYV